MNPAQPPQRRRLGPPCEPRYPSSTHEPPGAAMRNTLPVNRGPQPSGRTLPAASPRCPLNHTYLLPEQSHPHSTVLCHSTAKPAHAANRFNTKIKSPTGHMSVFGSVGTTNCACPEQFSCQICI